MPGSEGAQESPVTQATKAEPAARAAGRLVSLDAYRGFIMVVLAGSQFGFPKVAAQLKDSAVWQFLASQVDHVRWTGCTFWDLIQPSFMFMVGVAMPYSDASRRAKGQSTGQIAGHVLLRSFVLIVLGIFLSSNWSNQTDFTFVNVLSQIGLGYAFVYMLLGRGTKLQLLALAAILIGYWLFFVLYPVPGSEFDYSTVGPKDPELWFSGFFGHWDKNANAAAAFDRWFLNLFPRPEDKPFVYNEGGYQTLNFVPSMATMIFGLMAGELLRSQRKPGEKFLYLLVASMVCLTFGLILDHTVCPSVKRIWTPSWAIYSAGWTFTMLAAFYALIDLSGYRRWAFPLVVVGMNSIAMYIMGQLIKGWVGKSVAIHLGHWWHWTIARVPSDHLREKLQTNFGQDIFGGIYGPVVQAVAVLLVLWLICLWMYRQKIFVRI